MSLQGLSLRQSLHKMMLGKVFGADAIEELESSKDSHD